MLRGYYEKDEPREGACTVLSDRTTGTYVQATSRYYTFIRKYLYGTVCLTLSARQAYWYLLHQYVWRYLVSGTMNGSTMNDA
jgi:hypothetical protein